jgi:DNA-binding response OmpR family regulator
MNPKILICDDNPSVHESISILLSAEDIDTISVYNGEDALAVLRGGGIDLMILDIMLPGMSGTEVCREIRRTSDVPIIMLSALGSESNRIQGLRLGADDYVTKPFSPLEITERVRAILRRTRKLTNQKELHFAELTVNPDAYTASVNNRKLDVTPNEVKMLVYFIKNAGKALSREQLLNAVWGFDYCGDSRAVDSQIVRLRRKLSSENIHFKIESVYGIGYKLEEIT